MRLTAASAFIVLLCFGQSSHAYERTSHTNGILRGPYLQFATPHSIYVVWRTDQKNAPLVRFGTDLDNLEHQACGDAITTRYGTTNKHVSLPAGVARLHSAPEGCYQYEAHLTNLTPDTLYYYGVFNSDVQLSPNNPTYHFKTHLCPERRNPCASGLWAIRALAAQLSSMSSPR